MAGVLAVVVLVVDALLIDDDAVDGDRVEVGVDGELDGDDDAVADDGAGGDDAAAVIAAAPELALEQPARVDTAASRAAAKLSRLGRVHGSGNKIPPNPG